MSIKNVLKRVFSNGTVSPHQPYIPTPPTNDREFQQYSDAGYTETEAELNTIAGLGITFGKQKTVQVDNNGNARDISQNQSYIIGTNKRISDIEDIGGICCFCQEQAMEIYRAGLISLQQAQLKSLFDKNSAMQCDICGTYTCPTHTRPTQTPQGILAICLRCSEAIRRQQRRKKIVAFLLSPFTVTEENKQI